RENRQSLFVRPNARLIDQVKEAQAIRNTVVVVVDPWSIDIQPFQQFVKDFDAGDFTNCGVVVTWPPNDPETNAQKAALAKAVSDAFSKRIDRSWFYRGAVESDSDFRKALEEAFYRIVQDNVPVVAGGPTKGPAVLNNSQ